MNMFIELEKPESESRKQTIYDLFAHHATLNAKNMFFDANAGILEMTYPSGFKFTLRAEDFPNRNLVPHYKVINGRYMITAYTSEPEPEPVPAGPSGPLQPYPVVTPSPIGVI